LEISHSSDFSFRKVVTELYHFRFLQTLKVAKNEYLFPLAIFRKMVYAYIIRGDRHNILNSIIRIGLSKFKRREK